MGSGKYIDGGCFDSVFKYLWGVLFVFVFIHRIYTGDLCFSSFFLFGCEIFMLGYAGQAKESMFGLLS